MADKQSGTGARGTGQKADQGRGDAPSKNPVSAKNNSKQKTDINRSAMKGNGGRAERGNE